jgi:hypothetical protein
MPEGSLEAAAVTRSKAPLDNLKVGCHDGAVILEP